MYLILYTISKQKEGKNQVIIFFVFKIVYILSLMAIALITVPVWPGLFCEQLCYSLIESLIIFLTSHVRCQALRVRCNVFVKKVPELVGRGSVINKA